MRLLVPLLLVGVATARRSARSTVSKRHILDHWGYPYGWGLEAPPYIAEEAEENKVMKAKQVKRVIKKKAKEMPSKKTGWFGNVYDPKHPHWMNVEEAMDGLE